MVYATEEGVKDYLRTLQRKEYDPLTKKEEQKLLMRYKQNNDVEARNMLVSSNLRYACSLVNSYVGRGLSYSELISEANNGLIESIDKFDTSSFSLNIPECFNIPSTNVVFPWST